MPSSASPAGEVPQDLRRCLGQFATGVTIVTFATPEGPRGLTVNSFTSVSLDPPLVLVCIDRRARAHQGLGGRPFAVNVLTAQQERHAWHFAGRPIDGLSIDWDEVGGTPRLSGSLAWLSCEPWQTVEAGDHSILVGRVRQFGIGEGDGLGFFRGRFVNLGREAAAVSAGTHQ